MHDRAIYHLLNIMWPTILQSNDRDPRRCCIKCIIVVTTCNKITLGYCLMHALYHYTPDGAGWKSLSCFVFQCFISLVQELRDNNQPFLCLLLDVIDWLAHVLANYLSTTFLCIPLSLLALSIYLYLSPRPSPPPPLSLSYIISLSLSHT